MFVAKVDGTTITEMMCGPETWLEKPGYVQVQDYFGGSPGMDIRHFRKEDGILTGLLPLSERIASGLLVVPDTRKVIGEEIVQKTLDEMIADGVVKLSKTQMVDGGEIREMTAEEQVKAGVLKLKPTQKATGNMLEDKNDAEMYLDGTKPIPPNIRMVDGAIVYKKDAEMYLDGSKPLPPGKKIDTSSPVPVMVDMTIDEQVSAGQMTRQTAETIKSLNARATRDTLLAQSDWTQVPDVVLTEAQESEWKTYRKALRDIPAQGGFPDTITWPMSPDGVTN